MTYETPKSVDKTKLVIVSHVFEENIHHNYVYAHTHTHTHTNTQSIVKNQYSYARISLRLDSFCIFSLPKILN